MNLYVIRREDFFKASSEGYIPEERLLEAGSIWITIPLTEDEARSYPYPICLN
jgi:hypothetical protein